MVTGVDTLSGVTDAVSRDVQRLRQAAGQVVGSVFFGTLLKTMRESKLKGPFGHGGRGEEIFGAQLHGMWAEKIGETSRGGVSDAIYGRLKHQQELLSATRNVEPGGERT